MMPIKPRVILPKTSLRIVPLPGSDTGNNTIERMRIKINGPITPERLTEALTLAAARFGGNFGGFYGGNLYLCAYNEKGEEIVLCDENGKEVTLLMQLPPGMPMRPALAPEVIERQRLELQQRKELEARERERRIQEEMLRRDDAERRKRLKDEAMAEFLRQVKQFKTLLAKHGEVLILQMNEIVAHVWATRNPRWPYGKDKGQVRAMPVFAWSAEAGEVMLYRSPEKTGSPRKIQSPISYLDRQRNIHQYWQYEEWHTVTDAIQQLLADLEKKDARK
jgi:hypothetical protein